MSKCLCRGGGRSTESAGRTWSRPPEHIHFNIRCKSKEWKFRHARTQRFICTWQRILETSSFTYGHEQRDQHGWYQDKLCSRPRTAPNENHSFQCLLACTLPIYSQSNCPFPMPLWLFVTGIGTYSRGALKTCLTEKRPDGCQINSAALLFL